MLPDLKILVVDDSLTMRRIIVNTLKRLGCSGMIEATDGKDAISKIKEQPFDLVITEWNMPQVDGITMTDTLRRSEKFKDIPVLMITSRSVYEDIVTAIQAGVSGYIVKPFTPETLKEKIEQTVRGI